METTGGGGFTLTTTLSDADPPGPEQLNEYVCDDVRLPVDREPDVPVHSGGETVQEVALVEVQLIVAAVLFAIEMGPLESLALISAVGGDAQMKSLPPAASPQPEALQE